MLMCIKTGVHAWLEEYDVSVYGDAFALANSTVYSYDTDPLTMTPDSLIIRICEINRDTTNLPVHIVVSKSDIWFDMDKTSQQQSSTLIARPVNWRWLGYNGIVMENA
jgi:hypothetical protein